MYGVRKLGYELALPYPMPLASFLNVIQQTGAAEILPGDLAGIENPVPAPAAAVSLQEWSGPRGVTHAVIVWVRLPGGESWDFFAVDDEGEVLQIEADQYLSWLFVMNGQWVSLPSPEQMPEVLGVLDRLSEALRNFRYS